MAGHFSVADDEVDEEMLLNKESGSPPGFAGRWYTKWVLSALAVSCAGVLCLHLVFTHTGPAGPRLRQLSSVSCDGKPHGSGKKWAIVDGGCNEYYGCSHGGSVRKDKCMLTLIWDEEKQVCDDPEKVTCGDSRLRQLSSVSCDGKTRGSGKKVGYRRWRMQRVLWLFTRRKCTERQVHVDPDLG